MNWTPDRLWLRAAGKAAAVGAILCTASCASGEGLNPFVAGGVNRDSPVSAEVVAASRAPGGFPRFSQIPALPTDVRPVPAWREAVISEWGEKRKTEQEAASLTFTLANTDAWAETTRARIPFTERSEPTPSTSEQTEAFAATARSRATPPPPPQ